MTKKMYYRDCGVDFWNVNKGDVVIFILKRTDRFVPGQFYYGTVTKRINSKEVMVRCGQFKTEIRLHVACVRITKQAYENTAEAKEAEIRKKREAAARVRHEKMMDKKRKIFLAKLAAKSKPQSAQYKPKKAKKIVENAYFKTVG